MTFPFQVTAKPRIAYNNLLETGGGTITTTSDQVDYEHQNAYDWKPFTFWKPVAGANNYITAVHAAPKPVNYFCFYNQTVYQNSGTLTLQYSLNGGGSWLDAATSTPLNNKPVYLTFGAILATHWRVKMSSVVMSQLAVVAFGLDMELEQGVWVGFTPPPLGRTTVTTTMTSENGTFIGRSVIRQGCKSSLDLDHLTLAWVRAEWMPFVLHAELKPFFLSWSPNKYADEAAFCWVNNASGDIADPKHSNQKQFMTAAIKFQCNVE